MVQALLSFGLQSHPSVTLMAKATSRKRDSYHVGNLAEQLIDAARVMLEEVGPHKLSIRAVSDRVGVSCTAAYHHFANRSDLLSHLAAQGFKELAVALRKRESGKQEAKQLLRAGVLAYFGFARSHPALYQLMFGPELAEAELGEAFRSAKNEAFHELKAILSEVLGKPIESYDVHSAALGSWSYTHGLSSLVIHGVMQLPPGKNDSRFVDRSLQGFELLFSA